MEIRQGDLSSFHCFQYFEGRAVIVGGNRFTASLVITPDEIFPDWPPTEANRLTIKDLEVILELKPELAIIGTGDRQYFPDPRLFTRFMRAGVGIDFMNTRAACRTFNVLVAEGRFIAAGIILDDDAIKDPAINFKTIVGEGTSED